MPGFEAHQWLARKVGVVIGPLVAGIAFIGGLISSSSPGLAMLAAESILIGFVGYYSTLVGGAAPDIDLSQSRENLQYASIPYRKFTKSLQLLVAVLLFFTVSTFIRTGEFVTQTIGTTLAVALGIIVLRSIPDFLHRFMPAHRKITHDLLFWGLMGCLGFITVQKILLQFKADVFVRTYLPVAVSLPIFLGVVTHVSMDTVESYVQAYAPAPVKQRVSQLAPWVPKYKPILLDIPQLLKIIRDRRAPWSVRLSVILTFAYGVMPLDLITDVIPIIGWTDDLAIYLSLRNSVYEGYRHEEGIIEGVRRYLSTIDLYLTIFLWAILSMAILLCLYYWI